MITKLTNEAKKRVLATQGITLTPTQRELDSVKIDNDGNVIIELDPGRRVIVSDSTIEMGLWPWKDCYALWHELPYPHKKAIAQLVKLI